MTTFFDNGLSARGRSGVNPTAEIFTFFVGKMLFSRWETGP